VDVVYDAVHSHTALEETVDRLGTAIKIGLLAPGERLPAERELCSRLGISRSTLRQALAALVESGHVYALRGRGGGTFVSEHPPPADPPSQAALAGWRDTCDRRLAVELAAAMRAAERAGADEIRALYELVDGIDELTEDFPAYRQLDVRLHLALAEAAHSPPLVREMAEAQSAMGDLIALIAHPAPVLASSNEQHRRVVAAVARQDVHQALVEMAEHVRGTEHILSGLMPGPGDQKNLEIAGMPGAIRPGSRLL